MRTHLLIAAATLALAACGDNPPPATESAPPRIQDPNAAPKPAPATTTAAPLAGTTKATGQVQTSAQQGVVAAKGADVAGAIAAANQAADQAKAGTQTAKSEAKAAGKELAAGFTALAKPATAAAGK